MLRKGKILCKPCAEAVRSAGERLEIIERGCNMKITCDRCGCRRYGAVYGKKDGGERK